MDKEYICNDRPMKMPKEIADMTDEEFEIEYQKRFGKYEKAEIKHTLDGSNKEASEKLELLIKELKEKELIEKLISGEKVECTKCKTGIYQSLVKDTKSSHDFICDNCNDHIHIVPNIIVD